jgi:hypothetical protein
MEDEDRESTEQEDREEFISKIIDGTNSYLDTPYLPHVMVVLNSVPIADLEKLSNSDVALFAIDPKFRGHVLDRRSFSGPILYLSPQLLSRPENEIRGTIAHEFAHVALNHMDPEESAHAQLAKSHEEIVNEATSDEDAADRLAESWGFKLPQSYRDRL